MKARLISLFTLSALLAGCVGTGPNTQQGAVAGGAIGALAGAIIGNNSGGRNALGGAIIGGAAGAIAGGAIGNSLDHQRGTIYNSESDATTDVTVQSPPPAPPPPEEIIVEQPAPDMVWVEGHWIYTSRGYAWVEGYWMRPPPYRHRYVAPHWQRHRGGYVYIRGYWR